SDRNLTQYANSAARLIEQSERNALLSASFVANLPEFEAIGPAPDFNTLNTVLPARKTELDLQELSFYLPTFQAGDTAYYYGGPPVTRRLQVSADTNRIRDALILAAIETREGQSGIAIAPQSSQIIGAS